MGGFNGAASCGTRKAAGRRRDRDGPDDASMGPRLVGRGKIKDENGKYHGSMLQWGRVLWDAERRALAMIPSWPSCASMGPRLVGRGKEIGFSLRKLRVTASMGPRLVGRGKFRMWFCLEWWSAASMGPRLVGRGKDVSVAGSTFIFCRFNGAASCGTRKVSV